MRFSNNNLIYIVLILFCSCATSVPTTSTNEEARVELSKQLGNAVLWYQRAAEMQLAYEQAYAYARILLDRKLQQGSGEKPPAVVLDIDETVLDNSPYEAMLIKQGKVYEISTWNTWVELATAEALPGAKDFVQYAADRGVEVYYISNRSVALLKPTLENLKKLEFPYAYESHVLLKEATSDKTSRRNKVRQNHEILLFVGDNLADYSHEFADRDKNMGKDLVEKMKSELLNNFIMLPNPMYGEWEGAIYGNNYGLSDEMKLQKREQALKDY